MLAKLSQLVASDGMKGRAIRGTSLSVLSFGSTQLIRLLSNLILTRILFPEAFGLMAIVQLVVIGLESFSDMGIHPAIIQSKRGTEQRFLDTAWTMQIARGLFLWILACVIASPIAQFYGQEDLLYMIPVLGMTTIISGFRSTNYSLASRNIILGRITAIEITSGIVGVIILISLSLWLKDAWALVIGSLLGAMLHTGLSHIAIPGKQNRLAWDSTVAWEIFHFGKYIVISTVAGYLFHQGDRIILGKYVELDVLAVYTIAFLLGSLPLTLNQLVSSRVLTPLYKQRPPMERAENYKQIQRARAGLIFGSALPSLIFVFFGNAIIDLLYDERYSEAGDMLVLICLATLPSMIGEGYRGLLIAVGNSFSFTRIAVIIGAIKIIALLILVPPYGVIGAIFALALTELITYPAVVLSIQPYRGWNPKVDTVFALAYIALAAIVLKINPSALALITEAI